MNLKLKYTFLSLLDKGQEVSRSHQSVHRQSNSFFNWVCGAAQSNSLATRLKLGTQMARVLCQGRCEGIYIYIYIYMRSAIYFHVTLLQTLQGKYPAKGTNFRIYPLCIKG
jgi:hypothetical protein